MLVVLSLAVCIIRLFPWSSPDPSPGHCGPGPGPAGAGARQAAGL